MTLDLALLQELAGLSRPMLVAGFLVFLRVGAAMAMLPAFGEQAVPQRIKLMLALAFAAVVTPAVLEKAPQTLGWGLAGGEVVAGLALGVVIRLFVMALQIAGSMIAQATSLSQIAGGVAPEPQPAVGHLLTAAGLALAVMAGLHVRLAEVLILSYQLWPTGGLPEVGDVTEWGLAHIGRAFALGFTLATPFTIAALLYNLALGAINRAMPALMVSFIGAPALAAAGLAMMAVLSPFLLSVWSGAFSDFLTSPFGLPP